MWSLLYFMFVVFLYFVGFIGVLLLGLTAPIWVGPLALVLGVGWTIDQIKSVWT